MTIATEPETRSYPRKNIYSFHHCYRYHLLNIQVCNDLHHAHHCRRHHYAYHHCKQCHHHDHHHRCYRPIVILSLPLSISPSSSSSLGFTYLSRLQHIMSYLAIFSSRQKFAAKSSTIALGPHGFHHTGLPW